MADEAQSASAFDNVTHDDENGSTVLAKDGISGEFNSIEDLEPFLTSSIIASINAMKSMAEEYETNLMQHKNNLVEQWRVNVQCLEKLTEAATETRTELIEKKESQMKNIRTLAGVLNGLSEANVSPEA